MTEDQLVAPELTGLSEAEARSRAEAGQSNADTSVSTKSVPRIVADHALTLFNAVNVVLALLVVATGSFRNLMFLLVVGANLVIGIVQEVRSKLIVDRLSILAQRPVTVRRGGADVELPLEGVVLGDLVVLRRGDQVPADCELVWGTASANESLLTGESDPIAKACGDSLMSGSFLDSGTCVARVTHVGADSYAAKINAEAKYVKRAASEIMVTLQMIIRFASLAMPLVGGALFLRTLADGAAWQQATLTTVAALVGMIPQGLVLLTSTVLVISTARLARQSVLVQQFYCIEMLARVDVLCLDKTGTITSGEMDFVGSLPCAGVEAEELERALACVARANRLDANETARALLRHVDAAGAPEQEVARAVPFDSARKYSGCVTAGGEALVMGAAQFVLGAKAASGLEGELRSFGRQARTLVVARVDALAPDGTIEGEALPLGVVALSDHIRDTAPDTIRFFLEQGVTLNVISGDDPQTVSAIAQAAGVPGAAAYVDATTLETPADLERAAATCHVFGRVTPEQKRELVRALQRQGHTVAMTGDGVNDVLALREADCSVAMASGSDAARNVAEVVLVDDDFAHMPAVVAEGRRSINNLQRSASLFLVKTVFSGVLALLCAILPPYPFEPIQMSLVSAAIIGVPSFVLALEPNHERVRGDFLANVLARSLPASAAIVAAVGVACLLAPALGMPQAEVSTLCLMLTCLVGTALVVRLSWPLDALRGALVVVVVGIVLAGFTVLRPLFGLVVPTLPMWVFFAVAGVASLALFTLLFDRCVRAAGTYGAYLGFIRKAEARYGSRGRNGTGASHR